MPLLSICIPCYKRVDIVRSTLNSIYIDNKDVDTSSYEVVISENDPDKEIFKLLKEYNYPNIKYIHSECEGFMNSYYSLLPATGDYLKLHNSQVKFLRGSLSYLLSLIRYNQNIQSYFFFSNAEIKQNKTKTFDNFDSFTDALSYWISWSNGFGIWKKELDELRKLSINLNRLFPHTSLFMTQTKHEKYIIDNTRLFEVQRVSRRGDHNKFEAFTIELPSILSESVKSGSISPKTYKHIINDIMIEFLPSLLFNKYVARIETFAIDGYKNNIQRYYPKYAYWITWLMVPYVPIRYLIKIIRIKLHKLWIL